MFGMGYHDLGVPCLSFYLEVRFEVKYRFSLPLSLSSILRQNQHLRLPRFQSIVPRNFPCEPLRNQSWQRLSAFLGSLHFSRLL